MPLTALRMLFPIERLTHTKNGLAPPMGRIDKTYLEPYFSLSLLKAQS